MDPVAHLASPRPHRLIRVAAALVLQEDDRKADEKTRQAST